VLTAPTTNNAASAPAIVGNNAARRIARAKRKPKPFVNGGTC